MENDVEARSHTSYIWINTRSAGSSYLESTHCDPDKSSRFHAYEVVLRGLPSFWDLLHPLSRTLLHTPMRNSIRVALSEYFVMFEVVRDGNGS